MARRKLAGVLAVLVVSAGCGPSGPEVRVTPLDTDWAPARLMLISPALASGAVPAAKSLPAGLAPSTAEGAQTRVLASLETILKEKSSVSEVSTMGGLTRTDTGTLVERLRRQYLDERRVDPGAAIALGNGLPADALLLTAILRYGVEVEDSPQQAAQNAVTKVGTSDIAISSATTRTTVWFNLRVRCALVRCVDGVIMWDAAIRDRRRRSLLGEVTMETVADEAMGKLLASFPWLNRASEADGVSGVDAPVSAGSVPGAADTAK